MKPCRIVIADDHEVFRKGLQFYLNCNFPGAEIVNVSSSEALIKAIIKNETDLVISDIDMEGRSGLCGLEQIKKIVPAIPVLILSWYDEEVYGMRAIRSGASAYLSKHAMPEEIVLAVTTLLGGKKYITESIREMLLDDVQNEPLHTLSNQELEVMKLTVFGYTIPRISERLTLAATTVISTRSKILRRLRLNSIAELTKFAIAKKMIRDI